MSKISRIVRRPYRNISLSNTKKAYSLLDNQKLVRQQQLYKLFNLFSKNEKLGQLLLYRFPLNHSNQTFYKQLLHIL